MITNPRTCQNCSGIFHRAGRKDHTSRQVVKRNHTSVPGRGYWGPCVIITLIALFICWLHSLISLDDVQGEKNAEATYRLSLSCIWNCGLSNSKSSSNCRREAIRVHTNPPLKTSPLSWPRYRFIQPNNRAVLLMSVFSNSFPLFDQHNIVKGGTWWKGSDVRRISKGRCGSQTLPDFVFLIRNVDVSKKNAESSDVDTRS